MALAGSLVIIELRLWISALSLFGIIFRSMWLYHVYILLPVLVIVASI